MAVAPTTFRKEYELIKSYLREKPLFIGTEHTFGITLPAVWQSLLAITLLSVILNLVISSRDKDKIDSKAKYKRVYQATNASVNTCLAVLGYYYYLRLPPATSDFEELCTGHNYATRLAALQIGYQLWSIPFGLTLVKESILMLGHHVSVIFVAAGPTCLTTSFKYYAPFFFGVIEVSSVPLAVMNAFKDNDEWIQKYPRTYANVRLLFAVTFLSVRWVLYIPYTYHYGRLLLFSALAAEQSWLQIYLSSACFGTTILLFMQTYWGTLVLKGVLKKYVFKPKTK